MEESWFIKISRVYIIWVAVRFDTTAGKDYEQPWCCQLVLTTTMIILDVCKMAMLYALLLIYYPWSLARADLIDFDFDFHFLTCSWRILTLKLIISYLSKVKNLSFWPKIDDNLFVEIDNFKILEVEMLIYIFKV